MGIEELGSRCLDARRHSCRPRDTGQCEFVTYGYGMAKLFYKMHFVPVFILQMLYIESRAGFPELIYIESRAAPPTLADAWVPHTYVRCEQATHTHGS